MKTPCRGNLFRITDFLWGELIGYRWIPLTKASNPEYVMGKLVTHDYVVPDFVVSISLDFIGFIRLIYFSNVN